MQKEKLVSEIQKFIKSNTELATDSWAWYDLPNESNLHYMVLMDWQEGYDSDEHTKFVDNGCGLNVSIRVETSQYFKNDNPYPICTEHGDILDGVTLSEDDLKDDFKKLAEYIYDLFQQAKACEGTTRKFLAVQLGG